MNGSKKPRVVVAESSVSASQMQDFWRKNADGTIDGDLFQQFLDNPRRFAAVGVTLARALKILGEARVLTAEQATRAMAGVPIVKDAPIRFSENQLRDAARENEQGIAEWRLAYVVGQSLRERREVLGTDPNRQPCFYKNGWWLEKTEDEWATRRPEAGYYLLDFKGRFGSMSWQNQEKEIAKLGSDFERADEAVIAETATSIFLVRRERLLETWYHWGRSLDSCGRRVYVGDFDRFGWLVSHSPPDWADDPHMRVCLSRKFQK